MKVWEERLDQLLGELSIYAEDWDDVLEMVAAIPPSEELLHYLEELVPRTRNMQRRFNWVEYKVEARCYLIHNYDYKMYQYVTRRYPDAVITPNSIVLTSEELTEQDRDKLNAER